MYMRITIVLISFFCLNVSIASELMTPDAHVGFLKSSLRKAEQQVVIVSPFISNWALNDTIADIRQATARGVQVVVLTDENLDKDFKTNQLKERATKGREMLEKAHVTLKVVSRIHTKNVIIDNAFITFGSFNWLSAVTNPNSQYCNFETTHIKTGPGTEDTIVDFKLELLRILPASERSCLGLRAEYVLKDAIDLYCKFCDKPLYREIVQDILLSHVDLADFSEGLFIIRVLKASKSAPAIVTEVAERLRIWKAVTAEDFLALAQILQDVSPPKAKEAAQALVTAFNPAEDYDSFDFLYLQLTTMGMTDLANTLEGNLYGR